MVSILSCDGGDMIPAWEVVASSPRKLLYKHFRGEFLMAISSQLARLLSGGRDLAFRWNSN